MGRGIVGRQIHRARRGIRDGLIHLSPRVEIEQSSYYLAVDLTGIVVARQGRADAGADRGTGRVVGQLSRHEARHLRLGPVGQQGLVDQELHPRGVLVLGDVQGVDGVRDGRVHLSGAAVGSQGIGDGGAHLDRGAVGGQSGQDLVADPDLAGQRRQQGVGLPAIVGIAGKGQGPVIIGQGDAERSHGVKVSDLICSDQQVPGDLALPGGGVDKIGGASQGGDLRQNPVDGGLQRDLQCRQLRPRGKRPGVLQS